MTDKNKELKPKKVDGNTINVDNDLVNVPGEYHKFYGIEKDEPIDANFIEIIKGKIKDKDINELVAKLCIKTGLWKEL